MENTSETRGTLYIAKDHVAPLIEKLGMVRNELAPLFDYPQASVGPALAADAWWQGLSDEHQYTYRAALAAIASPQLIVDVGINSRNERLTNTHAVLPSLRWNDPIFLMATEKDGTQFRLEYLKQADLFTNTLLLYLQGGVPVFEMEMKFEIPVRDFAVLLSAVDLRQKLRFRALLDHNVYPTSFKADDIAAALAEAFTFADPRWLLPFSLPVLHLRPDSVSPASVRQSLDNLAKAGLMKKDGDTVTLTEPGEVFAESTSARISSVGIDTYGVDANGNNGRQSALFIRGEHLLWYAGVSGTKADTVVVTCISLELAGGLLKELFTPVAAPRSGGPAGNVAPPAPSAAAPQVPAGTPKKFCPSCGKPLKQGLKFCNNCGAKIS